MKKTFGKEDLNNQQMLDVKQRATDIWFRIVMRGDTCYSYGNDYHYWWNGLPHGDPMQETVRGGLVNLDDLEDIWTTLQYRGYLHFEERPFRRVIAEEVQAMARLQCQSIPFDPRLEVGLSHTRGKRMKHIITENYIWEWLRGTHTTMTI